MAFSLNLEISLWSLRTFKKMSPEYFANTNPRKPLPLSRLHPKNSPFVLCLQASVGSPPPTNHSPHPQAAQGFSPSLVSRVSKPEGRGASSRRPPWCPQRVTSELRTPGSLLVPLRVHALDGALFELPSEDPGQDCDGELERGKRIKTCT